MRKDTLFSVKKISRGPFAWKRRDNHSVRLLFTRVVQYKLQIYHWINLLFRVHLLNIRYDKASGISLLHLSVPEYFRLESSVKLHKLFLFKKINCSFVYNRYLRVYPNTMKLKNNLHTEIILNYNNKRIEIFPSIPNRKYSRL